MPHRISTHVSRAAVGAFGTIASLAPATVATIMPQIELWLRIISLCVGIAVGTATFISVVLSISRKQKKDFATLRINDPKP